MAILPVIWALSIGCVQTIEFAETGDSESAVACEEVPDRSLVLAQTDLDVGEAEVGVALTTSVQLWSDGIEVVHLDDVGVNTPSSLDVDVDFTGTCAEDLIVEAGCVADVLITLRPTQAGPFAAELLFHSDDPWAASQSVVIRGTTPPDVDADSSESWLILRQSGTAVEAGGELLFTVEFLPEPVSSYTFVWTVDADGVGTDSYDDSSAEELTWRAPEALPDCEQLARIYVVATDEYGSQTWIFTDAIVRASPSADKSPTNCSTNPPTRSPGGPMLLLLLLVSTLVRRRGHREPPD